MRRNHSVFAIVMLITALAFTFGCQEEEVNEFELLAEAGDAYFSTYSGVNINIDDLVLAITGGEDLYLIDWRSAEDYADAHIAGAVNMALTDLDDELAMLPADRKIINICYTGQTASFATAAMNLAGLDAQNLKFGMCSITNDTSIVRKTDKWAAQIAEDEGFPLETTANELETTYEFPTLDTGEDTVAGIIAARLDEAAAGWSIAAADVFTGDFFVVNYWPEDQYLDPGHIPGAYQFTPKEDLASDAKLAYLPTDETIVVYCYSGQTSAQVSAYLRLLGYDAKSLLFGMNGFDYASIPASKYTAPQNDYTGILGD